jgi:hypothetical protein
MDMNKYLTICKCGRTTSRAYARAHNGDCKACAEHNMAPAKAPREEDSRNARIIDSGWQAYAREEGHHD